MPMKLDRVMLMMAVGVLVACSSGTDTVRIMAEVVSPDRQVVARYVQYLYGGAAGGIGHCISVSPTTGPASEDCPVLGSHLEDVTLAWAGNTVVVRYSSGDVTRFREDVSVSGLNGRSSIYKLRLQPPSKS